MAQCKCCKREKELRMGYCFNCVEAESVIQEGVNMFDEEIPIREGLTKGMSKLQYILEKYVTLTIKQ